MLTLEAELEEATLDTWCDVMPVLDLAGLREFLRDRLTAAQGLYFAARRSHNRAAVAVALRDIATLTALTGVVDEELSYRRRCLYVPQGRAWPLAR